jgi:hypothetical protein
VYTSNISSLSVSDEDYSTNFKAESDAQKMKLPVCWKCLLIPFLVQFGEQIYWVKNPPLLIDILLYSNEAQFIH